MRQRVQSGIRGTREFLGSCRSDALRLYQLKKSSCFVSGHDLQLAEKVAEPGGNDPSAAKAVTCFKSLTYELKLVPFKNQSFSAACKAVP